MRKRTLVLALLALATGLAATAQSFTPYTAGTADIYAAAKANYPSGVYNNKTTVVLNDLEDHNWTLYSDTESPIRSLYPRNIQIIYSGQGKYYTQSGASSTLEREQPASLTADFADLTSAAHHQVGIGSVGDERSANRLVYLKTLERGWPYPSQNRFACRAIANPFSRRPTSLAAGTITPQAAVRNAIWLGFYRWRLKSVDGGSIYTQESGGTPLAVGDLVKADQLLWYQPTNNSQTNANNELSMAVEFEAVWTRAYLLYTGEAALTTANGLIGNSMELNFVVYRYESTSPIIASANSVPATYTSIFPNGTTDGVTTFDGTFPAALATVRMNVNLTNPIRMEYMKMEGGTYIFTARGNSVTFGRGLQYAANDLGLAFVGLNRSTFSGDFTGDNAPFFRFESGRHSTIEFVGVRGLSAVPIESYTIFGNDYDRALGDNTKLTVTRAMQGGTGHLYNYPNTEANRNRKVLNVVFKSGHHAVTRPELSAVGYYTTGHSIFLGSQLSTTLNNTYLGHRVLIIEGGRWADILGARTGYNDECRPNDGHPDIYIRYRGGTNDGFIGGAAQHIRGGGNPVVICTGGRLDGYIAAGANATRIARDYAANNDTASICSGDLLGNTNVYVGGNFHVSMTGDTILGAEKGCIFASGCGFDYGNDRDNAIRSRGEVNNSTVVVADHALIDRNVFGGGHMGNVKPGGTATIYIAGGTVNGKVFGGGNRNKLTHGHVNIIMKDGTVRGGIHGGSNNKGLVSGDISVRVEGGTVGYDNCTEELGNVYGCGYGEATMATGDVRVTIGKEAGKASHQHNPVIHQSVYGGGYQGTYNATGHTFYVKTWNGLIKNSVFGAGHGTKAVVTGDTEVQILGTTHVVKNVYGGGNMGKVVGNTHVQIGD